MPRQKGRARDTVPQQFDRKHKKFVPPKSDTSSSAVAAAAIAASKAFCRAQLASDGGSGQDEALSVLSEVWLCIVQFAGVSEVCIAETLSKAMRRLLLEHEASLWEPLCRSAFPSMWNSLKESGTCSTFGTPHRYPCPGKPSPHISPMRLPAPSPLQIIEAGLGDCSTRPPAESWRDDELGPATHDWKLCYVRRLLKQRAWDAMRGRTRSLSSTSEDSGSTVNSRVCSCCGERFGGIDLTECIFHPGDFLPKSATLGRASNRNVVSAGSDWSRAELAQLQNLVRAAWRSAGGSTGVRRNARNYRGGGHWAKYMGFKGWGSRGHWAEGCGPRPGPSLLRDCIDGKVPCAWSCCGSEELISEGCRVSSHR